jgi:hypothetical protein
MASVIKADTLQSTTSNVFVLNSAGTEYARFDSSGNLGIGATPSASAKLLVAGAVSVTGTTTINGSDVIMTIGDNRRTVSTSTTTGAIVSGGGLGVWGDVYAGGIVSVAGGGIKFPATQNASGDANTLDDYEEGTYTPSVTGSTSGGPFTFGTQSGYYTKIGREVKVSMFMSHNSTITLGGAYKISLPFAVADYAGGGFVTYFANWIGQSPRIFQIEASTTYGYLRTFSTTEMVDMQTGHVQNNTSYMLTIIYKTT